MDHRQLGATDLQVSSIGYGASSLGGVFHGVDEATGIRAVRTSLELGVTLIDVSPYYGLTVAESVLGKALVGVPRDSFVLATKVGRYGDARTLGQSAVLRRLACGHWIHAGSIRSQSR